MYDGVLNMEIRITFTLMPAQVINIFTPITASASPATVAKTICYTDIIHVFDTDGLGGDTDRGGGQIKIYS